MEKEYRIWYRQYDENRNLIGEGQTFNRTYKRYGNAVNAARKRYDHVPGIEWIICRRNPFVEYTRNFTCPLCGRIHTVRETADGIALTNAVFVNDWGDGPDENRDYATTDHIQLRDLCPECTAELKSFINKKRGQVLTTYEVNGGNDD